jgi:adenylylsulfate kinase
VAHVSQLLARNGIVVVDSFVSPYVSSRKYARDVIEKFVEVFVSCSVEVCMKRDPKGLYKKAASGQLANMTGVQDSYEPPTSPEIVVNTESSTPAYCAQMIMDKLQGLGYI